MEGRRNIWRGSRGVGMDDGLESGREGWMGGVLKEGYVRMDGGMLKGSMYLPECVVCSPHV